MGLNQYDEIVALGGREYVEMVRLVFPAAKCKIPFESLPLGKLMKAIRIALVKSNPYPDIK